MLQSVYQYQEVVHEHDTHMMWTKQQKYYDIFLYA